MIDPIAFDHEQFARDGFAGPFDLPAGFVAPYQTPDYLDSVTKLFAELKAAGGDNVRKFGDQHMFSRSVFELASEETLMSRVRAVMGPDVLLWVAHVLVREPGDPGQAWHVDAINQYVRGLHVSVAITDNTLQNGCLHAIPRTHLYRPSLMAAEKIGRIDRTKTADVLRFADEVAPWNRPHTVVEMPLRAGQYFFTWGGLWHFVGPHVTTGNRAALVARYVRTDFACREYGFSDYEIAGGGKRRCILVSGEDRHGLNDVFPAPVDDPFRFPGRG